MKRFPYFFKSDPVPDWEFDYIDLGSWQAAQEFAAQWKKSTSTVCNVAEMEIYQSIDKIPSKMFNLCNRFRNEP